jgi:hypothetical protein
MPAAGYRKSAPPLFHIQPEELRPYIGPQLFGVSDNAEDFR